MRHEYIKKVTQKVKASYAAIAGEFDQTRKRQWPEFEYFLAYVKKHSTVLDLGCGNGRLCEFLGQKEVNYLGVDHNSHLLEKAKENNPEAKFELADMVDLNLEEGAFDNIFCIAAFHHVPTKKMRKKVLSDMHSALKEDGILILTTWNLFQAKYIVELIKSILRSILTLGLKGSWNDFYIKWGNYPIKRFYHSFLPSELRSLFNQEEWKIEEFYFTKKGKRVSFLRSFNIVVIARKK